MTEQSIFQLLNPLVYTLLGFAFIGAHAFDTRFKSARILAAAYFVAALATILDYFRDFLPGATLSAPFAANIFYIIVAVLMVIAIHRRSTAPVPALTLKVLSTLTLLNIVYFFLIDENLILRTLLLNFLIGAIFSLNIPVLYRDARDKVSRILFAAYVISCIQFFVRPMVVIGFFEQLTDTALYSSSLSALAFKFSSGLVGLTVATLLLFDYALRIVENLRLLSLTDTLTGCLNRRGFEDRAAALMEQAAQANEPVGVIMADIDRFKAVNDTYGHYIGDKVIVEFTKCLNENNSLGHVVGRLGGEEFAVLVRGHSLQQLRDIADEQRMRFASKRLKCKTQWQQFSASFGIAILGDGEDVNDLLARADDALYLAKQSGRNCVKDEANLNMHKLGEVQRYGYKHVSAENDEHGLDTAKAS